jgi:hypothetical protein
MREDGESYVIPTTKALPDERTDRENLPVFCVSGMYISYRVKVPKALYSREP